MVCGPWGSPRTSQRSTGQNHFHDNTNTPFAIFPVLSLAQMSKSNSASMCWCLSTNPGSGTNHYGCVLFTPHTLGEERASFTQECPDELSNSLIFLNPHPLLWVSSIFFVENGHYPLSMSASKYSDRLEEKHHTVVCVTSSTSHFFMQCHFYLKEQLINYSCSDFGIWQKFS